MLSVSVICCVSPGDGRGEAGGDSVFLLFQSVLFSVSVSFCLSDSVGCCLRQCCLLFQSVLFQSVLLLFQPGEEMDEAKRADDTLSLSELSYQSTSDSGRGGSEFDVNNAGHKDKGDLGLGRWLIVHRREKTGFKQMLS